MKARWQEWSARFDALQQREKVLVSGAVVAAILLGGQSLWVDPPRLRAAAVNKQLVQKKADLAQAEAQMLGLAAQVKDPDAANKAALADARAKLAEADQTLRRLDAALVPPQRVPQLLQTLIGKHRGLELVSLKTLAPTPVIAVAPEKGDAKPEAKPDAKAEPKPAAPTDNIFKHGIEIKVAGAYADLLAYVAEIENMPQKVLLGKMSLNVTRHPRSELALTVYSLSLDSAWLVV